MGDYLFYKLAKNKLFFIKFRSVIDNDENTCLGKFRDLSKGC